MYILCNLYTYVAQTNNLLAMVLLTKYYSIA